MRAEKNDAFGRVTELRRAGRLDEAYALARRELEREPGSERVRAALGWVLYDQLKGVRAGIASQGLDAERVARALGEVAGLALPEQGNEVFFKNLFRLLASLGWELREHGGAPVLRELLAVLQRTTRVVSDVAWRADAAGAGAGLLAVPRSAANKAMAPFLAAFRGSEDDLAELVAWSGEESFALAEDVRRGAVGRPGQGEGEALSSLPRTPIYVEWTSPAKGSLGVTAYRRGVATGYGPPSATIERSVVRDPRLAALLAPHEVYEAVLSSDGRSILGTPARCEDEGIRSSFVRRFEGTFESVGAFGFVRLPGGTAASGDLLVPQRLVERHRIADLSRVSGTAAVSFRDEGDGGEADDAPWGFVVESVDRVEPPRPEDLSRRVRGQARGSQSGALFVDDVLLPARLVAEQGIRSGQLVEADAHPRWDKRRRAWGWIARSARRAQ